MSTGSETARCGDAGAFDVGFVRTDQKSNRAFWGPEPVQCVQHVLDPLKSRRLGPIKSKNARFGDTGAFDVGFVRTDQIERSKDASGPSSDHPNP